MKRGIAMNPNNLNNTFDPQTLADDFLEVRRIYTEFFATLDETRWDKPVKGGSKNGIYTKRSPIWLHSTELDWRVSHALRGEPTPSSALDDRYKFNAYNRKESMII
jgi:hypothetical protein